KAQITQPFMDEVGIHLITPCHLRAHFAKLYVVFEWLKCTILAPKFHKHPVIKAMVILAVSDGA
ncbi:MAG: hypothetical protein ACJAVT_001516, partial [Yoonia sp.]